MKETRKEKKRMKMRNEDAPLYIEPWAGVVVPQRKPCAQEAATCKP